MIHKLKKRRGIPAGPLRVIGSRAQRPGPAVETLEIVLKCDSFGTVEAVTTLLGKIGGREVEIKVIHSGVGDVTKNDILMALTGSRLVAGFNVGLAPRLEQWTKEHGVEVRLYNIVYTLAEDLGALARSLIQTEPEERILGRAKVIATFKSSRGSIIAGCEVLDGVLAHGRNFRVVKAMGPVFTSRIESLQVEKRPVREVRAGQQAGLKVTGFVDVRVGDYIECFDPPVGRRSSAWSPRGAVLRFDENA
ncbi:translation initiation factor 2 GTPase [Syntrophobacter fumaroxidans]|uniref:Translation initiation factor IF-2 n=1 Tax=Syntrophobacter fumaroxidans (strain DSM 10017 / MPOB) TaxID=335543 RepID=A0LEP6_SYNFM|nr:translation initiation factor 2 GTPase [Syntrophobacter fumaroxidans]ABK15898.1 Translation initiation factor 2 (IF-2; GTPase)-like [Syntrophobacter fumaroxidans MPOB]